MEATSNDARNQRALRRAAKASLQSEVGADALLRIEAVMARTGLSRTTIYEAIRAGKFPAPIKLGARCARWRAGVVGEWLAAPQR